MCVVALCLFGSLHAFASSGGREESQEGEAEGGSEGAGGGIGFFLNQLVSLIFFRKSVKSRQIL